MSTRLAIVLVSLAAAGYACGPAPKPPAPAARVAPPAAKSSPPVAPAWAYWESLDAGVTVRAAAPSLPLAEDAMVLEGGARARWEALPTAAQRAVLDHGFVVVPRPGAPAQVGEAYATLRDRRVPYLITLDALFWLAHVARDRALAAVEDRLLAPAVDTLLQRLDARLAADLRPAPADLVTAYGLARGVVAVGRALLSPVYKPPPELAVVVADELRHIEAHAAPARSSLLGVTVDYSQIVPRGGAADSAARGALARAIEWLGAAPLVLAGRGEVAGSEVNVGAARVRSRAALLVAHYVQPEVDAEAAEACSRLERVARFVGGESDDLAPRDLAALAGKSGIDVRDLRALTDTAKLDRLRHAVTSARPPRLDDGGARRVTSVRLLPARDALDAELLQALVAPQVGPLDAGVDPAPATSRGRVRALPTALDVAAWLGSDEARAVLREQRDDAYAGYDDAMKRFVERKVLDSERHGSAYASSLAAVAAYLGPSAADPVQPGAVAAAWRLRKVEAALAAWTTARHDALAFARFPTAPIALDVTPVSMDVIPAFVEPHPEAIAQLVSLVRQVSRGLRAVAASLGEATPLPLVDDVEQLLVQALAVARLEASDEPFDVEAKDAMESFPARLYAIERALSRSRADDAALAVDVHTDVLSGRALLEGTGELDELYALVREPSTGRLILAVGVASSHYEVSIPARERLDDSAWRARLRAPGGPARAPFTARFRAAAE